METFSHRIEAPKVSLFFITDVHEGNANHCEKSFRKAVKHIEEVAKERHVITILGGDMVDAINTKDPRFSPSEISDQYKIRDLKDLPRKQMQRVAKNLAPIKDTIIASLVGNHEEAYIKHNGSDIFDYLCSDLLDCKKLGYFAMMQLTMNHGGKGKTYNLAMTHGTGGGGYREGYPLNNAYDIFRKCDTDINIMGHVHRLMASHESKLTLNKNAELTESEKWHILGGCFLKTYQVGTRNYFEAKKGQLSDIGFPEIKFDIVHKNNKSFWDCDVEIHSYERV